MNWVRECRVVQHAEALYSVRVRQRPAWWPWFWLCRWRVAVEGQNTVGFSMTKAEALRDLAEQNGIVPGVYDSDCQVIVK